MALSLKLLDEMIAHYECLRLSVVVEPGFGVMRGEVLEVKPSRSKPGRGLLRYRMTIFNQHGEDVMSMVGMQLIKRRTTD